jgi:hypothetical protein
MLYDLLCYVVVPTIISTASIGTLYLIYPEKVKQYLLSCSWRATEIMVDYNDFKETMQNKVDDITQGLLKSSTESDDDSDSEEEDSYLFFDRMTRATFLSRGKIQSEKETIKQNKNLNVIFLNRNLDNKEYLKRIENIDQIENITDETLEPIEKQFIQVEYITEKNGKEEIYDIHNHLGKFYVNGNIILDRYFLDWYLHSYYNMDLDESYKLRIFDKDVLMFIVHPNQGIMLANNSYSKLDIDENTFQPESSSSEDETSDESEYEGAKEE